MKIERDIKNSLLKRREVVMVVEAEKNPGFEGAKKMMSDQFKATEDTIVVKKVEGSYGRNEFTVDSYIYDSVADKEMVEPRAKVKAQAGAV